MLGDHIRALKGGQWVHGIDLGDQRVLHLVEEPGLTPADRLRRVYKPEFTAGASRVELVVHRERTYPARAVVARAWSRYMDPSVVAMFRDSEQFAAWCKIGRVPEVAPPATAAPTAPRAAGPAPATAAATRPASKAARAPAARKPASRKPAPRTAAPRKAAARKTAAKKAPAKPARKAKVAKRPAARKAAPRKPAPAKKAPARRTGPAKKKGRR